MRVGALRRRRARRANFVSGFRLHDERACLRRRTRLEPDGVVAIEVARDLRERKRGRRAVERSASRRAHDHFVAGAISRRCRELRPDVARSGVQNLARSILVLAGSSRWPPGITSHAGSSYAWSITNGTITAGQTANQVTFTAGVSGTVALQVIETNGGCASSQAAVTIPIVGPPQNVIATASSSSAALVSWLPNGGAPTYEVMRRGATGGFVVVGMTAALSFSDTTVSPNTSYLYAVRAVDSMNNRSANSNLNLATTVIFTDDPLVTQLTKVKATHLSEIRIAANSVRALAGLTPLTFTNPVLDATVIIKAIHVSEIRTALDEARAALTLPALTYTDATVTTGATTVKAAHLRELRDGMK